MNSREFHNSLKTLKQAASRIQPDPAWLARTRGAVVAQAKKDLAMQPAPVGFVAQTKNVLRFAVPQSLAMAVRGPVLVIASLILVISGGSAVGARVAEKTIPGDFLYPVKLAVEQTRLMLTQSKTDKLKLKTEFVGRRMEEMKEIAVSDGPEKSQRIQDAAEILKRDLDTVKNQLHEVSSDTTETQVAQAAKLIDQKSLELATVLKNVKTDMPANVKTKVAEAEAAAVNVGVKAVQVLITAHKTAEMKDVMSDDELLKSIEAKINGMETGVADATQKILDTNGTSTAKNLMTGSATGTLSIPKSATTSTKESYDQITSARASLAETKQLIQENKLDEAGNKLQEVAKAVATVEKTADALAQPVCVACPETPGVNRATTSSNATPAVKPDAGSASGTTNATSSPSR